MEKMLIYNNDNDNNNLVSKNDTFFVLDNPQHPIKSGTYFRLTTKSSDSGWGVILE